MSVVSCEGSALIPLVLPPTNSINAVGSVIVPTLLSVATASTVAGDVFTPFTLPKGVWLMNGVLTFSPSVPGTLSTIAVSAFLDGGTNLGVLGSNSTLEPSQGLSLSYTIVSDGTNVLHLEATVAVSTADWILDAGVGSLLKLVKLA